MDEDDLAAWVEEQYEDQAELARMMDPEEPVAGDHAAECVYVSGLDEWCCAPGCTAGRL